LGSVIHMRLTNGASQTFAVLTFARETLALSLSLTLLHVAVMNDRFDRSVGGWLDQLKYLRSGGFITVLRKFYLSGSEQRGAE